MVVFFGQLSRASGRLREVTTETCGFYNTARVPTIDIPCPSALSRLGYGRWRDDRIALLRNPSFRRGALSGAGPEAFEVAAWTFTHMLAREPYRFGDHNKVKRSP